MDAKSFHQSVGTNDDINLSKMVNLPGLNTDGDLITKTTPAISGTDVLKVSKFNVDVSLASPELKLSHVSQGVHADLDHTYTVPSVALNPYAGQTHDQAAVDPYAEHSAQPSGASHVEPVGVYTTSPVMFG